MNPDDFKFLSAIIPEKIKEKLLDSSAKSLGGTFGDLVETATAPLSIPLHFTSALSKSLKWKIDNKFSKYNEEELEFKDINIQQLLKYVNDLKYSLDSEEIQNMFANLIVKSFVKEDKYGLHPAFSAIVSELSPLDAKNLAIIYEKYPSESFAIVDYKAVAPNGSYTTLKQNVFLENKDENDLDVQTLSIENLERLKLLFITNSFKWEDSEYNKFRESSFFVEKQLDYNEMKEIWRAAKVPNDQVENWVSDIQLNKKTCELTTFGRLFCALCFKEN